MQIITFKYTKSDGSTTERVLLPFTTPGKMYAGMDISELDTEDQAFYITEVEKAKAEYTEKLAQIARDFDMQHRYRQFKEENMSDVKVDTV